MSFQGSGMLLSMMDIDPADETEFDRWSNKEHIAERVAMPGFLCARRYRAVNGSPNYLGLYETESPAVLDSPIYRERLAKQSPWTLRIIPMFRNMHRAVAEMRVRLGAGHGAALAMIRLNPVSGREDDLRAWLADEALPPVIEDDDVLSAHVLESDPALSGHPPGATPDARDWFVLIEGTDVEAVAGACAGRLEPAQLAERGSACRTGLSIYRLLWGLSRWD